MFLGLSSTNISGSLCPPPEVFIVGEIPPMPYIIPANEPPVKPYRLPMRSIFAVSFVHIYLRFVCHQRRTYLPPPPCTLPLRYLLLR